VIAPLAGAFASRKGSRRIFTFVAVLLVLVPAQVGAQAPVEYRLSFPEAERRLMTVDVHFDEVPAGLIELRMSRSSPGRYALHEFAKNVFDVRITDASGAALPVSRPNPHQWNVTAHNGSVRVAYRIFGDRVDGTYLGIDSTHAHINMPAALMWARGFEMRPVTVRFAPPAGTGWRVGTQLFPGADPFTFTAPNLQYLMDSPTEVGAFSLRTITLADAPGSPVVRLAVHHTGTDAELDDFTRDVERIVREAARVYGEFPAFDGNTYTFIADYLPSANGDGMEHRNSTIVTNPSSIRSNRLGLLDTISHEFFHAWNVERIRPRALEPFNFEDANMSGELWLAEGFTSYYGPLVLLRSGVSAMSDFTAEMAEVINVVQSSPGRRLRSAEEMSQLAPFVDGAAAVDRTGFLNTYTSYYTWGAAIGLGLDLTLRDRSNGAVTLDHFMRALWQKHGKPGGKAPGYVDVPYTMADLKAALAAVAGDAAFADDFFARFIQGREVVNYEPLLARAGLALRLASPGRAFAGEIRLLDAQGRARTSATLLDSPVYQAGLDRDDVILAVGGTAVASASDFERLIRARKPGDAVPLVFERRGERITAMLRLVQDPRLEIVRNEDIGRPLTDTQRRFREAWLSSTARNSF
jgi:predicted metalloprotease with PDZ domain